MNDDQIPNLSEGASGKIAGESSITQASTNPQETKANGNRKPTWLLFFESAGAVALITVLIGGIMGGIITAIVQEYQKEREFQQLWLKARGDLALATSKEYQDKELEIVNQAFDLLGRCITVSDDLIYLTSPVFDPTRYEESDNVRSQRLKMLKSYNDCRGEWRRQSEKLKLLMSYYHHGQSEVAESWQKAQDSVTAYMKCAHRWYETHIDAPANPDGACPAERNAYSNDLNLLNQKLNATRRHLWQGWESPERLREALKAE